MQQAVCAFTPNHRSPSGGKSDHYSNRFFGWNAEDRLSPALRPDAEMLRAWNDGVGQELLAHRAETPLGASLQARQILVMLAGQAGWALHLTDGEYDPAHYEALIDSGPLNCAVWKHIRSLDAMAVAS